VPGRGAVQPVVGGRLHARQCGRFRTYPASRIAAELASSRRSAETPVGPPGSQQRLGSRGQSCVQPASAATGFGLAFSRPRPWAWSI